ncbi:TIGR04282 family arsenosugar biosynthesis glycosyltransferase [Salibacteraceae bacterium]|nr:TIGR04282 family arsenosugar biosynthesis glycosyltransferase [Salibacteraceae bacterium]MDC1304133.1 TIGR04282 family arsenosugar biosynthesis glycosyltransferase [Salibacteraceae bacterium]
MTENDRLIIFVKNPEIGRVKTRLAKTIGDEQALSIYQKLLLYTKEITKGLNADKSVYYSEHIDNNDLWDNMLFSKHLQRGDDLGERMQNAFADAFAQGKERVIIIGSDCLELETYMIKEAFAVLENNDVVLGPAKDGGYYMIGMTAFLPTLFEDKNWSTDDLLMDTILDLKKMNAKYYLLKTLNDIDTIEDLKALDKFPHQKNEDWF